LAGVGALPYGVKWLLNGEVSVHTATTNDFRSLGAASDFTASALVSFLQRPARRDPFEKYVEWKPATFDKGAPYTKTYVHMFDREALEAEWRQAHASSAALQ
jgi:hypothetical protein